MAKNHIKVGKKVEDPVFIGGVAWGSDEVRGWKQGIARAVGRLLVGALGLRRAGFVRTEIVQAIRPVAKVGKTGLVVRCDHGRVKWRAERFEEEEPWTVKWVGEMKEGDCFWDIGANIGIYSLYGASGGAVVFAFEPEAQNYAELVENVALNGLGQRCFPLAVAIIPQGWEDSRLFALPMDEFTRASAWHHVRPVTARAEMWGTGMLATQILEGKTLDAMLRAGIPAPTHLKVDIDGGEGGVLRGGVAVLRRRELRLVQLEVVPEETPGVEEELGKLLEPCGFRRTGEHRHGKGHEETWDWVYER